MRITVRVRPGASRTAVGGVYGDEGDAPLVVAVSAPAVDGRATQATIAALAEAFGVRRHDVSVVSGATSRTKVVDIAGEEETIRRRLMSLRAGSR